MANALSVLAASTGTKGARKFLALKLRKKDHTATVLLFQKEDLSIWSHKLV